MALTQITSEGIKDDEVKTADILNANVTTAKLADGSVTGPKLATESVSTVKIGDGQVTAAKLAADAVTSTGIADNAVVTAAINADAVTAAKIADNAVVTAAINADAVTGAKIADDAVAAEHLASNAVVTASIVDDAVTADKLANSINTEIAANTAKTTNATHTGEVTGATALTIADDIVDEANLKISNAGSNGQYLQKQSGNTGGLTWATASSQDTLSFRNLVINGAMLVNQRATQATSTGYNSIDRFAFYHLNVDEAPTYAQSNVASGTTPYELGFRKCLRVMNGNQTGGAGAGDQISIDYRFEAQDIANSGWNYTSASSYITLSFWVKSSVAQDFKLQVKTEDGTEKAYPMSTGALSANTWTKITKTIPGHADLTFDNNNAKGFNIHWFPFVGTDLTASVTDNAWMNYSGSSKTNDSTSTWYTTNDATFDITGVQLEVGDVATNFEHRSYGDELIRCQRYFEKIENVYHSVYAKWGSGDVWVSFGYNTEKRSTPTVTNYGGTFLNYDPDNGFASNALSIPYISLDQFTVSSNNGGAENQLYINAVSFKIDAEI